MSTAKPIFMNGYWRAVVNGHVQPHCYLSKADAQLEMDRWKVAQ